MKKQYPGPLVFGLDIGTRSVVGTVGYKKGDEFVVVAQVSKEHVTRAMLDGQIHDINKVAETIFSIKTELEEMIDEPLKDVCIAAAGRVLKTINVKVEQKFGAETVISNEHIYALEMLGVEKAYDQLREDTKQIDLTFYCVGYSVVHYYLNDYMISNLESHKAYSISAEVLATFLPDEVVDGLYAAVEKAGLYVANLTLEPIAAINVAIPEKFRLLNIALVDVGAGTSDISVTKDGSIVAYGMIPSAGDGFTEILAKHYLTDFNTAEKIKRDTCTEEVVVFDDVMGITMEIPGKEVLEVLQEQIDSLAKSVAERIRELNGGSSVNAVFVVGGGGKVPGFVEKLAEYLELPEARVALRGKEVMDNITFLQEEIEKDALLVTPVGICLNYYEQRNNFIFVQVNGQRVKLYDNSRLTIMDAAMTLGFPNEDLFPQRGKPLNFRLNGEKRMMRGLAGEAAKVVLNGKEGALRSEIEQNDRIDITASTIGKDASLRIGQLAEYKATIRFIVDGKAVDCPKFAQVDGKLVPDSYQIQEGDDVQILDYYTLEQVLEFMDIDYVDGITVNHEPADADCKVYENFSVQCNIHENLSGVLQSRAQESKPLPEEMTMTAGNGEGTTAAPTGTQMSAPAGTGTEMDAMAARAESVQEPGVDAAADIVETAPAGRVDEVTAEATMIPAPKQVTAAIVHVNGIDVTLLGKPSYILVDVLDFYEIDLSVAKGNRLVTKVNGGETDFTQPVADGDTIEIYWE